MEERAHKGKSERTRMRMDCAQAGAQADTKGAKLTVLSSNSVMGSWFWWLISSQKYI